MSTLQRRIKKILAFAQRQEAQAAPTFLCLSIRVGDSGVGALSVWEVLPAEGK